MGYNANSIPSPHHHPPPNTNIMFPIDLGPPSFECIKLLLADNYDMKMNPLGWLMSEKLDGVRCFWTGSCMYSRNGNKYNFP